MTSNEAAESRQLPRRLWRLVKSAARTRSQRISWVTADLAFGPVPADTEWEELRRLGLRSILEVRAEGQDDVDLLHRLGFQYRRLPILEGGTPAVSALLETTNWIRASIDDGRRVFVHCREGRGRSALVVCASLLTLGFPLDASYALIRSAQPRLALSLRQARMLQRFAEDRADTNGGT